MSYYQVNGTVSFSAWLQVEADSPEEALEEAREYSIGSWDFDTGTGEIELDVMPRVEKLDD